MMTVISTAHVGTNSFVTDAWAPVSFPQMDCKLPCGTACGLPLKILFGRTKLTGGKKGLRDWE